MIYYNDGPEPRESKVNHYDCGGTATVNNKSEAELIDHLVKSELTYFADNVCYWSDIWTDIETGRILFEFTADFFATAANARALYGELEGYVTLQ